MIRLALLSSLLICAHAQADFEPAAVTITDSVKLKEWPAGTTRSQRLVKQALAASGAEQLKLLQQAVDADGKNAIALALQAAAHAKTAFFSRNDKQMKSAVAGINKAAALDPGDERIFILRAQVFLLRYSVTPEHIFLNEAQRALDQARLLEPSSADADYYRVFVHMARAGKQNIERLRGLLYDGDDLGSLSERSMNPDKYYTSLMKKLSDPQLAAAIVHWQRGVDAWQEFRAKNRALSVPAFAYPADRTLSIPISPSEPSLEVLKLYREVLAAAANFSSANPDWLAGGKRISKERAMEILKNAGVRIEHGGTSGTGFRPTSLAGFVVTNAHVVRGAAGGIVDVIRADGRRSRGRVILVDDAADLAAVGVESSGLPRGVYDQLDRPSNSPDGHAPPGFLGHMTVGHFHPTPKLGTKVYLIGHPHGLTWTPSHGEVTGNRVFDGIAQVQTDAALNPGNSGGVAIDDRGNIVGVVSWGVKKDVAEGLSFLIGAARVHDFVGEAFSRR